MEVTYTIPIAIRYDGFVILCWLSNAYYDITIYKY